MVYLCIVFFCQSCSWGANFVLQCHVTSCMVSPVHINLPGVLISCCCFHHYVFFFIVVKCSNSIDKVWFREKSQPGKFLSEYFHTSMFTVSRKPNLAHSHDQFIQTEIELVFVGRRCFVLCTVPLYRGTTVK